jgi:stalled ribosome rescue protein Dom34
MGYVVCWLDSHDAKIFNFSADQVAKTELHIKKEDHGVDHFYHRVAEALKPAFEILVVGPGTAKTQFMHHVQEHAVHAPLTKKIKGVENMDHPTDNQIVAHARKFFHHLEVFKSI